MDRGGLPAFELWLAQELPHAHLVVTTDIPDCFARILRDRVEVGLPLPRRVKREGMFRLQDRAVTLVQGLKGLTPQKEDLVAKVSSPKRGIPQGTAPASVASEVVIGNVLRAVAGASPDTLCGSYGDNLIFLLKDKTQLQSVENALASAVTANFGSDVISELTRRTRAVRPSQRFSFCGRDYRLVQGKLKISISPSRAEAFTLEAQAKLSAAMASRKQEDFDKLERSVRGWMGQNAAFPAVVNEGIDWLLHVRRMRPTAPTDTLAAIEIDPLGPGGVGKQEAPETEAPPWFEPL